MNLTEEQLAQVKDRFINATYHQARNWQDVDSGFVPEIPGEANGMFGYAWDLKLWHLNAHREWWLEHGCPMALAAIFAQVEPQPLWEHVNGYGKDYATNPIEEYGPGSPAREQEWNDTVLPLLVEYLSSSPERDGVLDAVIA